METIHKIIIESVSGGFWKFTGYWIMTTLFLVIPAKVLMFLIRELLNTIRNKDYEQNNK